MRRLGFLTIASLIFIVSGLINAQDALTPPVDVLIIQTNGRDVNLDVGDYRSNASPEDDGTPGDDAPHEALIFIPCVGDQTYIIQLYDPAVDIAGNRATASVPLAVVDVVRGRVNTTSFRLIAPDGLVIANERYDGGVSDNAWTTFALLNLSDAPEQGRDCGAYTLQTSTEGDDENGWRIRILGESDGRPYDVSVGQDGVAGTGDEIAIGFVHTTFETVGPSDEFVCDKLYWLVNADEPQLAMLNFDMDDTARINYFTPIGRIIKGKGSADAVWNSEFPQAERPTIQQMLLFDSNRDTEGDAIFNPRSGVWTAEICAGSPNQFTFEIQPPRPIFFAPPLTPNIRVQKAPASAEPPSSFSEFLSYTITIENTGLGGALPIAGPELVERLHTGLSFLSCTVEAPLVGSCMDAGNGLIEVQLEPMDGMLAYLPAGSRGTIRFNVLIPRTLPASDVLLNDIAVYWTDIYGSNFSPVIDREVDTPLELALSAADSPVIPLTATPSLTYTPSITPTPSDTPTATATPTGTLTRTPSPTWTATFTRTPLPTRTLTRTPTPTITNTPTATATPGGSPPTARFNRELRIVQLAGGVGGGVAVLIIIISVVRWWRDRRRW